MYVAPNPALPKTWTLTLRASRLAVRAECFEFDDDDHECGAIGDGQGLQELGHGLFAVRRAELDR